MPPDQRPEIVVALCSEQAKSKTLPELEAALSAKITILPVTVPLIGEAQDIDSFLTDMVGACEQYADTTFTVDVTHGFRHLSFLMYTGVLYLAALGRVTIGRIYYALLNTRHK